MHLDSGRQQRALGAEGGLLDRARLETVPAQRRLNHLSKGIVRGSLAAAARLSVRIAGRQVARCRTQLAIVLERSRGVAPCAERRAPSRCGRPLLRDPD